jgi:hypothetical protein
MAKKPILVKVGNQFIEPSDVACITKCRTKAEDEDGNRHTLYIVRLKSNPNPEYPIWVRGEAAIAKLLTHFAIEE